MTSPETVLSIAAVMFGASPVPSAETYQVRATALMLVQTKASGTRKANTREQRTSYQLIRVRIRLLGVDTEVVDGVFDHRLLDVTVARQRAQGGERDVARIHLEEVAQSRAVR